MSGRGTADEAPSDREVTCTTCLRHVSEAEALMTERGPTCRACMPGVEASAASRSGVTALGIGIVVGAVLLVGVAVATIALAWG